MRLTVNGEPRTLEVEARKVLADALREDCGLTGTNVGCAHGVCGSCTVLVDGQALRSCLLLAVQCDGSEVRTVEGLPGLGSAGSAAPDTAAPTSAGSDAPGLHPLQEEFAAHHALQCGFCTPGFLVIAAGALAQDPSGALADRTTTGPSAFGG